MQAVKVRRDSIGRHRTQVASAGQVPSSQPKTMHTPPGLAVSHTRSPVIEQLIAVLQRSPIAGAQPTARTASDTSRGASVRGRMGAAA